MLKNHHYCCKEKRRKRRDAKERRKGIESKGLRQPHSLHMDPVNGSNRFNLVRVCLLNNALNDTLMYRIIHSVHYTVNKHCSPNREQERTVLRVKNGDRIAKRDRRSNKKSWSFSFQLICSPKIHFEIESFNVLYTTAFWIVLKLLNWIKQ